jgi:exodeoxyribonuclease V beta subunit
MTGFNILDPHLNVLESRFIEASAGTGKTFTLQHLIVRLLLSETPLSLERILVVTFTRAATMDLRRRVRQTLVDLIEAFEAQKSDLPYVNALLEQGCAHRCISKLRVALACFEEAKIYTIHSFCFQILQESAFDVGLSFFDRSEESSERLLKGVIKDLFRSQLGLSAKQLKKLFSRGKSVEEVTQSILRQIQGRTPICIEPTLEDINQKVEEKREGIFQKYSLDQLKEAFYELPFCFGKCAARSKQIKPDILKGVNEFLLKKDLVDSPLLLLNRENVLKSAQREVLEKWSSLIDALEELWEDVKKASDELTIFATVAEMARKKVLDVIQKKELLYFDDLILKVQQQLDSSHFCEAVRGHYDAVLIDEFQDTNPTQWKIFSTLFREAFLGPLVLVGDPKQAIYRFRQADIYTYLNARSFFYPHQCVELNCNYRSSPSLIYALNALFEQKQPLITLPKNGKSLSYTPVEPDLNKENIEWKDGFGSIVLVEGEEEEALLKQCLFEAIKLHHDHQIPLSQCAFLVKDRFQAARLEQLCHLYRIPVHLKGQRSLVETSAFGWLELFLQVVFTPQDEERMKRLLGTPLFGYEVEELTEQLPRYQEFFYRAHLLLQKEGLFSLYTFWKQNEGERLMRKSEILFAQWEQLFEALSLKQLPLFSLLPFLEELKRNPYEDEEFFFKQTISNEALQVMTLHVSKGLEYAVVFPVGLTLAPPKKRELVFEEDKGAYTLDSSAAELHALELEAERQRQLYVAFTRPKLRLYLPYLKQEKRSPLALFLEGCSLDIEGVSTLQAHQQPAFFQKVQNKERILDFNPPPKPSFASKRVESFSSLYRLDEIEEKLTQPLFPAGPDVGTLIHLLLEKLPFDKAAKWEPLHLSQFAEPYLLGSSLEEHYLQIGELLWHALHTPLPGLGKSLSKIEADKILKEVPFEYSKEEGIIKGFIDLVVQQGDTFYVIDWKSNHLDRYDEQSLRHEATYHHYHQQAQIYKEGLKRYLSLFDKPYKVGPSLYLFLRGLKSNQGVLCL